MLGKLVLEPLARRAGRPEAVDHQSRRRPVAGAVGCAADRQDPLRHRTTSGSVSRQRPRTGGPGDEGAGQTRSVASSSPIPTSTSIPRKPAPSPRNCSARRRRRLTRQGPASSPEGITTAGILGKVARLEATGQEATEIKPSLQKYAGEEPWVYRRKNALEAVVKSFRSPKVMVLSTHGFFLSAQQFERRRARRPAWNTPAAAGRRRRHPGEPAAALRPASRWLQSH